jgi:uncharacterized 2Fe-2S/4Fe-4S cluster protein (DUF4445 family)
MHTHATGWVQTVALAPPTLRDNAGDADRLAAALKSQLAADVLAIDLSLLQDLPARLRAADYRMRCVVCSDRGQWVLTHLAPAASPRPAAGLAVDLGTSRVALRLLDLATGTVLQESDFDNPQGALGPDILTRMHLAERGDGRQRLQRCIVDGLNREIQTCCSGAGIAARDIALLAVAGTIRP